MRRGSKRGAAAAASLSSAGSSDEGAGAEPVALSAAAAAAAPASEEPAASRPPARSRTHSASESWRPPVVVLTPVLEPVPPPPGALLGRHERWLPLVLLAVASFSRFWRIHLPGGIVFDELHFGKFTQWTLHHWFYFDIHPPFAKLTLAFLAHLWGYDAHKCDYEPPAGVTRMYAPDCEFWKLRSIVAAFSVGTCLLMYPILRRLGASPLGSAMGCLLEVFSIMHNVEGRLVLLNSQLLFWSNACLYAGLRWWARANAAHAGRGPPLRLPERLCWAFGVGFLGGCAFSIKHTGLATPGLVGVEAALGAFFLSQPMPMLDLVVYVFAMACSYVLWFAFHLWNFVYSHGTLRQEVEFMTPEYQSRLIDSATYDPTAPRTESFWETIAAFNIRMVRHSAATNQPHTWGSRPLDWIFNTRGVSYWGSTMGTAEDASSMYLFGNPLSTWAVVLALALMPVLYIVAARTAWYPRGAKPLVDVFQTHWGATVAPATFALLGWVLNIGPYAVIDRTTFAYHYLPGLLYGHLLLSLLVDRFLGDRGAALAAAIAGGTWLFYSPWIYGLPLSLEAHARRRWLERWN